MQTYAHSYYEFHRLTQARRRGRTFRAVCCQIILCLFGYLLILWLFGAGKCLAADYQPRYDLPDDWSIQLKLCQHNHDCYDRVLTMFGQTEV